MVYSLRRLAESSNSSNSSFLTGDLNVVREETDNGEVVPESMAIEQTGDYTFTMELEEPFAYALEIMAYSAFSVVPEGIVGDIEGYEGEMSYEEFSLNNPVGSGPFQFVEWNSGNGGNFSYDTFDDYHGEPASFDGIDLAILTDTNAIFNRFINGNADTGGIPTSQYDPELVTVEETQGTTDLGTYGPLEQNDVTFQYARVPTINTYYVGFNLEEVPAPVRKAMAYVINREQFVENVFLNRGSPSYHLTPSPIWPGGGEAYRSHWQGN
jgi:peptide/nickel transport system substrate-binding protein